MTIIQQYFGVQVNYNTILDLQATSYYSCIYSSTVGHRCSAFVAGACFFCWSAAGHPALPQCDDRLLSMRS